MASPQRSAALAMRESFGDRRIPEISRKITACVACRKQKLKCHMRDAKPPCARCQARGLPCSVNKSLQMLLEGDAHWKECMEQRLRVLEEAVLATTQRRASASQQVDQSPLPAPVERRQSAVSPQESRQQSTTEVALNLSCSLGSYPGSSVATILAPEADYHPGSHKADIVSSGLISLDAAEEYFTVYQTLMDPFLHRILPDEDCLANVRARSSFLTAAICTVGALYTAAPDNYAVCYEAFLEQVSGKFLGSNQSFDDVRALCIGAFWLPKVSSSIMALAVQISRDLYLHRCITKMPHVKRECYERTRLFFLVSLVDHHCSIIYGKPPMTRDFAGLKSPKAFLHSALCSPHDALLIAHLELWFISSRVFDAFGADIDTDMVGKRIAQIEHLSQAYRAWHQDAVNAAQHLAHPGDEDALLSFPRHQMLDIYLSFAQLFLFSHAFRGLALKSGHGRSAPSEKVAHFQRCSFDCALSIVQSVSSDTLIQQRLPILPSYYMAMVAFAHICLIRYVRQEPLSPIVDDEMRQNAMTALSTAASVFVNAAQGVNKKHPLLGLASSLDVVMRRLNSAATADADGSSPPERSGASQAADGTDGLFGHWFDMGDVDAMNGEMLWPGFPGDHGMMLMDMDAMLFPRSQ
ncbi:hypothetical protein V8C37DRAFT_274688 [Trichoderma ceciliae]